MIKLESYIAISIQDCAEMAIYDPNMIVFCICHNLLVSDKKIVLVTQKNAEIDDPESKDLYSYGCQSKILQLLKLPDGTVKVLVEGIERVKILECKSEEEYLKVQLKLLKIK